MRLGIALCRFVVRLFLSFGIASETGTPLCNLKANVKHATRSCRDVPCCQTFKHEAIHPSFLHSLLGCMRCSFKGACQECDQD